MRRHSLLLVTLLALGVAAPARAQVSIAVHPPPAVKATPAAVVARLMSFDLNHDGRVARTELPERMQSLLTRGDTSGDEALDVAEVRKLADVPARKETVRGFQSGSYGFGDGGEFDTRLHIDGALEDLRLAAGTKEQAFEIARRVHATSDSRARTDLLTTMEKLLTDEQLTDFKRAVDDHSVNVPAFRSGGLTFFGATPGEVIRQRLVPKQARVVGGVNLAGQIDRYQLGPAQKNEAIAAIQEYDTHNSGRLNDGDRRTLLAELKGVLDEQQCDDLRAALERRPIVKQEASFVQRLVAPLLDPLFTQPPAQRQFGIQNLLLVR